MLNDDVPATCPECQSSSVALSHDKITCQSCTAEEFFMIMSDTGQGNSVTQMNQNHMRFVLQRWNFAG